MQKVYMLTEEEYSMIQGQAKVIECLQKDNAELQRRLNVTLESRRTLSEQLAKAKQDHHLTSDIARDSIKERDERIEALRCTYDTMNKTLCEKAHEILTLRAEAVELSRKLRDAQALLGLIPEDALTIAKLTQLASMGK